MTRITQTNSNQRTLNNNSVSCYELSESKAKTLPTNMGSIMNSTGAYGRNEKSNLKVDTLELHVTGKMNSEPGTRSNKNSQPKESCEVSQVSSAIYRAVPKYEIQVKKKV